VNAALLAHPLTIVVGGGGVGKTTVAASLGLDAAAAGHDTLVMTFDPSRIVGFLDSGALRIALKPWFDESGHLRTARRLGPLGRGVEAFFDRLVGLGLLRDMAEFFQAFGPLYEGFRERASEVQALLRAPTTQFVLVTRPEAPRVPETLFFARHLTQAGHRLAAVVVNMVHPADAGAAPAAVPAPQDGRGLLAWMGQEDARGVAAYRARLPRHPLVELPLLDEEPSDLEGLARVRALVGPRWLSAFAAAGEGGHR
jgi:anion-transporting  ArsA/GET3 family ATPase